MALRHATLIFALAIAGCASEPPQRFAVPAVAAGDRIRASYGSVEVIEVSLPIYARTEEIWRETEDGALVSDPSTLWADEPVRAVTMELARQLTALTGARVAAEPWPFDEPAEARLEVRLEEMVAGADGRFRLAGQYFTADREGDRDRTAAFTLWAPIEPDSGIPGIAAARANAVKELARQIAQKGL